MTTKSQPVRVVVVGSAAPARGGIPSFVDTTARQEFFPHGTVSVSLVNTTRQVERAAGRLNLGNVTNATTDAFRTWRAARGADIVHVHAAPGRPMPAARAVALCAAGRLGGARVVCHVHSARLNSGRPAEVHPGRLYRRVLRGLRVADQIVTVSNAGARVMRELVPGPPVESIDNAVDVPAFALADPGTTPVTIIFVGTLSRRKGLPELCAALASLGTSAQRGTEWTACIVGGANEVGDIEATEIRDMFAEAGLDDALLGAQPPGEVRALLASSSVFVLPSHAEGQPIAMLEAMAAGLPVVVSAVGAIPDVVDSSFGVIVEPGNVDELRTALLDLIAAPERRIEMGQAARKRAEAAHDLDVLARRILAIYHDVLQRATA